MRDYIFIVLGIYNFDIGFMYNVRELEISKLCHNWLFSKFVKVEKILKGSMDLIPSPSPSVKIQIMGEKFVASLCNVLPYYLK